MSNEIKNPISMTGMKNMKMDFITLYYKSIVIRAFIIFFSIK